jgi:hypothetical protein
MNTITITLVQSTDGTIDQAGSEAAFASALSKYVAEREIEQTQIADKVSALFTEHLGKHIALPTVAGLVAQMLNAQPENHSILTERISDYIRDNSQGKKSHDGTVERPASMFVISKGKHGGVARRADLPVKA